MTDKRCYRMFLFLIAVIAVTCALGSQTPAQNTAAGTPITNQATATYSDGSTTYNATSNTVTVTVSKVAGLVITPDGGTNVIVSGSSVTTVNPGQTGILFIFTLTNTGNFSDRVAFKANGASVVKTGTATATVTRAVIDAGSVANQIDGGDTDIKTNGSTIESALIAKDGTLKILVEVSVNAGATSGQTVIITLGDASGDNVALSASAADVSTVDTDASITNGRREAVGDITATVATVGGVLLGPAGQPAATGTTTADDYTNKSVSTGINVPPGGSTTATGQVVFTNTVRNTGNASDAFVFKLTAAALSGFTVEVSPAGTGGTDYVNVSDGTTTTGATASVAADATANILVRISAPSGKTVLTGYDHTIRAISVSDNTKTNDTIDRLWTGFMRLQTLDPPTINNPNPSSGGATAQVPGATITYTTTYSNVTTTSGSNNADLSASGITIVNAKPNNTDFRVTGGSATSSPPSGITVAIEYSSDSGSTWTYTPTADANGVDPAVTHIRWRVTTGTLAPGASGTTSFAARIR